MMNPRMSKSSALFVQLIMLLAVPPCVTQGVPELVGVPASTTVTCDQVASPALVTATSLCGSVVGNGLQLYYAFDGAGVVDGSGNANTGVLQGAVYDPVGGRFGGGISLKGTGDLVRVSGTLALRPTNAFTVAMWYRTDRTNQAPLADWDVGSLVGVHLMAGSKGSQWAPKGTGANLVDTSSGDHLVNAANLSTGVWHHIAVTYDRVSGKAELYSDGVRTASPVVGSIALRMAGDIYFGAFPGWGGDAALKGGLDEIRVYNRVLASNEVQSLVTMAATNLVVLFAEEVGVGCPKVITRTWSATDGCGQTVVATQTITVVDTAAPVLTGVPGDVTISCGQSVSVPNVAAFDVCGTSTSSIVVTYNEVGSFVCGGVVTRTWTAVDGCANTAKQSQVISILEPSLPVLVGVPASVTVTCDQVQSPPLVTATSACAQSSDLVAYFPFDDGTAADASGNLHQGVLAGPVYVATGRVGGALSFLGTGDLVRIAASPGLNVTNAFTMAAWYYTAWSNQSPLIEWSNSAHMWVQCKGSQWAGRGSGANLVDSLQGDHQIGTSNRSQNAWHHLAVTYSRTSGLGQVYVDGVLATQRVLGVVNLNMNGGVSLGARPGEGSNGALKGMMDEVRIYSRVLSGAELADLAVGGGGNASVPVVLEEAESGSCPKIITRRWSATDGCGQTVVATQTITVVDTEAPVLVGVPGDTTILCGQIVSAPNITAYDICGASTVSVAVAFNEIGSFVCGGTVTRTWTAVDGCANTAKLSQVISILEPLPPVLLGVPASVTVTCDQVQSPPLVTATSACRAVVGNGLQLYYAFDGAGAADVSGNGNTGVLQGAVYSPSGGRFGGGISLKGTGDLVRVPGTATLRPTNAFTVAMWYRTDRTNQAPLADWDVGNLVGVHLMVGTKGGQWYPKGTGANLLDTSGGDHIVNAANLSTGVWHHIAVTYDRVSGKAELYSDGVRMASPVLGAVAPRMAGDLYLGAFPGWGGEAALQGGLDEVRLYNRVLASNEVQQLVTMVSTNPVVVFSETVDGSCPKVITRRWSATDGCGQMVVETQTITVVDIVAPTLSGVPTNLTLMCGDALPAAADVTAVDACTTASVVFAEIAATGCPGVATRTWTATDACGNNVGATQVITFVARDADGDGLDYFAELGLGTNPNLADTDGDGRPDGREVARGFNPLSGTNFPPSVRNDFDGEGESDILVYNPASATWYALRTNSVPASQIVQWGWSAATPVLADFDGDAVIDFTVYDSSGNWYVRRSSTQTLLQQAWGWSAATPVPGDFDGDGKADFAVYHAAAGNWYIRRSSDATLQLQAWGWSAATPVVGDFDGDRKADIAVYHQAAGNWYIRRSSDGTLFQLNWGWSAAAPVVGDYDGDGKSDLAVYHQAAGTWYIRRSSDGTLWQQNWGWSAAVPAAADYDHDGKTDLAVYDPATGNWYIRLSSTSATRLRTWGWSAALPVLSP